MVNGVVFIEGRESEIGTLFIMIDCELDGLPSQNQYHLWDEKVFIEKIVDRIKHAEETYKELFDSVCQKLI